MAFLSKLFERNYKASTKTYGVAEAPYVVLSENALALLDAGEIHRRVDPAVDKVVELLTRPPVEAQGVDGDQKVSLASVLFGQNVPELEVFEGANHLVAWDKMNATYLEREWGDGFPLVAPTPEAVARMLERTRRSPKDVVAVLEPCFGIATVEKIAINCVMAGCKPEHLPVLIAAVEAISDPRYLLRHVATSTTPYTPCLVVNGPIAKRIGMNSSFCCLGPGAKSAVNTAIGRAMRLILMNIAGNYVGVTDIDTFGDSNKYSMCLAENEEANPWEPLHVERGFDRNQSTVTAFVASANMQHGDHLNTKPELFLRRLATFVSSPSLKVTLGWVVRPESDINSSALKPEDYEDDILIILSPNHAEMLAGAGWNKRGIKEVLHNLARRRIGDGAGSRGVDFMKPGVEKTAKVRPEWQWLHDFPDLELPVYGRPENYNLIVAGGDVAKTMVVFGGMKSITRLIEE